MSADIAQLESTLKDLPRLGTLIKDRGYRQVWRFEVKGLPYFLKFYPRAGFFLKRMVRGNPAMREFTRLIALQKAGIPSPRAIAVLSGFRINQTLGDAVLLEGIEPSMQLDRYLSDLELQAEPVPDRRKLVDQIVQLVHGLSRVKLGHSDLHLGSFLVRDGRLYLLDGYAVRPGALRMRDLLLLGHSARRFATAAELLRAWRAMTTGGALPPVNRASPRLFRKFLQRVTGDNRYFGRLADAHGWRGHYVKQMKSARRFSAVSTMSFEHEDWTAAWDEILMKLNADQFEIIKRSRSGDVLSGEIVMNGRPIAVVIKRPRRKFWYRYLTDLVRPSRARRTWVKAWKLYVRGIPAEFPMLLMEKRRFGYVADNVIVFEKMRGDLLSEIDLDAMTTEERELMFHRTGRLLRRLEMLGFGHFDAKATNWIIQRDEKLGPVPILIDVDGVRHYHSPAQGIDRLLRAMRQHPQYTPADSLALCRGYAPWAKLHSSGPQTVS